ncbi:homologous recombination OB-fold protein isoform X2 [Alligator mississippiensis]|uniref:homologous recombination OB-fold protein isoform X2 n=1 Tax=Alligator mississippiensis TaxID=8496 RepID=UPI002877D906|nr:homologous recombination OB-fold protein isoform X2 [Alligator mississippiensis]
MDLLSAVEDAESQFSTPAPVKNTRCLRPLSSGARAAGGMLPPAQEHPSSASPSSSSMLSPGFGLQNLPTLRAGLDGSSGKTACLRPLSAKNDQTVAPSAMGFRDPKAQVSLGLAAQAQHRSGSSLAGGCAPSHSSIAGFRSVQGRPATCPVQEAATEEELDSELLLAACMQLDMPNLQPDAGPALTEQGQRGMPLRMNARDESLPGGTVLKKLRVGDETVTPGRGCSAPLQHDGAWASPTEAGKPQSPSPFQQADLLLKLRPSMAGSCSAQSDPAALANWRANAVSQGSTGVGGSWDTISIPRGQIPRPFQASLGQSGMPAVRAPHVASPSSRHPRPPAPQMPNHSCSTPRFPGSGWQPRTRVPNSPQPLMACIQSPATTPRTPCSGAATAGTLQTPVVTNHLVQLVTAASKTPKATPRSTLRAKTRCFPGPAGILPRQHGGKNLEEILISTPQTPAHGALAKLQTEEMPNSQQSIEDDFGKGPWIAMKTELGLDERDPSCFLRTYSVVMVLRKAALKQLPKNKVSSMAVLIKSLSRSNVDAGAVFKDPTGEMQGTVHRLLLEERSSELKAGAVLLLKQVGVFSPSHRNHYLNVTPNNLVKIYPLELGEKSPSQLSQEPKDKRGGPVPASSEGQSLPEFQPEPSAAVPGTVPGTRATWSSSMDGGWSMQQLPGGFPSCLESCGAGRRGSTGPAEEEPCGSEVCEMDDLDGLLGELPEDFFSMSTMESNR